MNWSLKLTVWRLNYGPNALIARVRKRLPMPTGQNLMVLTVCLAALALSGCAAPPPCPALRTPPKELMVPPPPPGEMQKRLEQILEKGQTSAPS